MIDRPGDEWWRRAVVYQIYPRSFSDSNGDGIGDLRGVLERVEYLAHLGVDAVWLSPVYASPQADNGYDISDYRAIDPAYGSLDDLAMLVEALHSRDIRVVMDLVVNHTSDQHPWFADSRSAADSPHRDWYWWRPPRPGRRPGDPGAEPNNWESFFSGPAWTWDPSADAYYLHLFSPHQPDLNWENPEVRHAVYEMMRWWLDRDIDGFRMDVINLISKDPHLPDGAVGVGSVFGNGFPYVACGPRLHEFLAEMRREVFRSRDRTLLAVGEMPGVSIAEARLTTDPARRELDMVFQFDHMETDHEPGNKWRRRPHDPAALIESLSAWQEGLAQHGWNSLYLGNHDQPRFVSRFGDPERAWYASATALATAVHLLRGTPFIFQGDELGMTNAAFRSIGDLRDVESLNRFAAEVAAGMSADEAFAAVVGAARDHARTPMPWSPEGGFSSAPPWISMSPTTPWLNVALQMDDGGSVLNWYRRLISLRRSEPVVVSGAFTRLPAPPGVFAYVRSDSSTSLVVVANLTGHEHSIDLAAVANAWRTWETVLVNVGPPDAIERGQVGPWQAVVSKPLLS